MIIEKLEKAIDKIAEKPVSILSWAFGFLGIVAIRTFIKTFLVDPRYSITGAIIDYLHEVFFFFMTFSLIWLFLSLILKKNPKFFSNIMFWGAWLMILSPVLDMIKTGGGMFWSFYLLGTPRELWSEFYSFFGNLPSGIVYFGPKIMSLAVIILSSGIVFVKTKNLIKYFLSAVGTYLILFFMGAIPSFLAFVYYFFEGTIRVANVKATDAVQLFGTINLFGIKFESLEYLIPRNLNLVFFLFVLFLIAVLFFLIDRKKFFSLIKNCRFPQVIYHSGIFFLGMGLGILAYPENFNLNIFSIFAAGCLLVSVWLSWVASVIVNDIYDYDIDKISNPERPLQLNIFSAGEYRNFGILFFILALIGGAVVDLKFAGLLIIYQFLAWAYSAYPYRIKKFPIAATFVSAVASSVVLFIGFALLSGDQNVKGLSWRIILLLLISYTISIPVKDFKDIEGDKKYGIRTLPVIFGEKKARLIVAINVFVSFILSVFFLNELRLFWWAMLLGTATFLVIVSPKIKPRQLFWPVLGIVFIYGLILVKIVFM